ncbi:MAG: glycosyltransferase [Alphaproteobacteria bacterium]|nr:glycosyltransferase [Alphaproteobacteria bacterium]
MAVPDAPRLSIIIPALNAAATVGATLVALQEGRALIGEVLVVDAGSTDNTALLAKRQGARILSAPRGRGDQLAAGAAAACEEWLLFLHADTLLEANWSVEVADFAADPGNRERAAVFAFGFAEPAPARFVARVGWRNRFFALPYGDQGLLIHRTLYRRIGGFERVPLMEDVAIVRRLGRRRLHFLGTVARTSAARYRGRYWRRSIGNVALLALYFLGAPVGLLRRLYG